MVKMLKRLWGMQEQFKKFAIWTMICVVIEIVFDLFLPILMQNIIDDGINNKDINYVIKMGIYMIVAAMLSMTVGGASGYLSAKTSAGLMKNMRTKMFNNIQEFSFGNMDKFSTPSLMTRLTTDSFNVRIAFMMAIRMLIRAPIMLVLTTILAVGINAELAIVFLVAIPILGATLYFIFKNAHPIFVVMMDKTDAMNADIQETLIGIRVVKTYVRQDHEIAKFDKSSKDVRDTQSKGEKIVALNSAAFELVMYACMIAISWFGGKMIIGGTMTTGEFMRYMSYIGQILISLIMISQATVQLVIAETSADRIFEVIDEVPEIQDTGNKLDLAVADGNIVFDHVDFSYSKNKDNLTLEDIDFSIESGQMVGIVGSTGAGKTSMVQLIPRLYDVLCGSVRVSGVDVREYSKKHLRDGIAMVLQKNVLFSGTIMENLRWGDENATDEEVYAACKTAAAHEFITSFPEGYETFLGQSGVNLSGGQKQRVCIARALLKKPKIMIMDDSTSAVDTATDAQIRHALKTEVEGMTTIIIAQRVSSIMDADKIIVMDDGKILDMGTHEELLHSSEIYRELYESQQQGVA